MADPVAQHTNSGQRDSSREVRHFHEECLRECKCRGKQYFVDPDTKQPDFRDADFYLYPPLQEYFEDIERVNALFDVLLTAEEKIKLQAEKIGENYVKIFAILIVIGEGKWIQYFVEHQIKDGMLPFPFNDVPDFWPMATNRRDYFWERFRETQWLFCPHHFEVTDLHTKVNPAAVLPLRSCEILDDNSGGTTIYRVEIYPDYHGLYNRGEDEKPQDSSLHNVFVIKSLDGTESKISQRYEQEVSAFNTLGIIPMPGKEKPSNEIVRCYGSFVQSGTYNILIEYADQGNLLKYFENVPSPEKADQMVDLWNGMADIASGVWRIHRVLNRTNVRHGSIHQGYHQDLKPANILVFRNGEDSPYRYTFKIADLGLSYFLQQSVFESDPQGPAQVGSRTYGSPQKDTTFFDLTHQTISGQASDLWSLGCIYSVVATWMVSGKEGIREFAGLRSEARRNLSKTNIDCFHDGDAILEVVATWHAELGERIRVSDRITNRVYEEILATVFESDINLRGNAWQLSNKVRKLVMPVKRGSTRDDGFENGYVSTPTRGQSQVGSHGRQFSQSTPRASSSPISPSMGSVRRNQWHGRATSPELLGGALYDEPEEHESQAGYYLPMTRRARNDLVSDAGFRHSLEAQKHTGDGPEAAVADLTTRGKGPTNGEKHSDGQAPGQHDSRCAMYNESTRPPPPSMRTDVLFDWKLRRDADKNASFPDPGLKEALKDHDHVFIVDDSRSMKTHWNTLVPLFGALTKFVKDCDPDELELYTTVSAKKPIKSAHSTKLLERVIELGGSLTATSQPERVLRRVLDDYCEKIRPTKKSSRLTMVNRQRKPTPLCVYMFTDGVWQTDTDLTQTVRDYVEFLDTPTKLPEYHIGIQFIRFGSDTKAIERLEKYDRLGKNSQNNASHRQGAAPMLPRDIVDTEPSDGNVWKMLLGAVNKWFDDDNYCTCEELRKFP